MLYSISMEDYQLPKSYGPLRRRLAITGVLTLLLCVVITLFLFFALDIPPFWRAMFVVLVWGGMIVLWALGALIARWVQSRTSYSLTKDSLCVSKYDWLGHKTQHLYRYDTILSIDSHTHAGGSYGSLTIAMAQQRTISLVGLARPDEQARRIKNLVSKARRAIV